MFKNCKLILIIVNTTIMLILTTVLAIGSGVSLAVFMNSLWDDNTANSYLDLDPESDIDNYTDNSFSANSPL
jgi:hypothetical protein